MSSGPQAIPERGYYVTAPSGERIAITRPLFDALRNFLGDPKKPEGRVEIDCRNGGIAGVRGLQTYR